jgi:hypothetical protein
MTNPTRLRPLKPLAGYLRPAGVLFLIIVLVLTGCATKQLSSFKKHAGQGDYLWIADQQIECEKPSEVCGQLHLIKGDACFRLAKADATSGRYACAADGLETGLALNPAWKGPAEQRQFQENLCESLRNLQDQQSGEKAQKTLDRLVRAAEGLYQLAPESVPAIYYLSKARLRQAEPELLDLNAADRVPVCNRLKRTLNNVLALTEKAKRESLPDWQRFADNYQRLAFDLGLAVRAAECN